MAAENGELVKQAFALWQAAGVRLNDEAAPRNVPRRPPRATAAVRLNDEAAPPDTLRPSQTLWALRALLHPVLRPFLSDPTQTINGRFPSLDSHAAALLETPEGKQAARLLGSDDRAALHDAGLWDESHDAPLDECAVPAAAHVGAIWGSLYLPALSQASPCRITTAWGSGKNDAPDFWPDPQTLRPASRDMENTGRVALAAALAVLRQSQNGTPPDLRPGLLLWDVCLPGLPDSLVENAQGESLQLPLALAFLSLFTGVPLPAHWAATGALGGGDANGVVGVRPVGFIREKAEALSFLGPTRVFFVPPMQQERPEFAVPVGLLSDAAAQAGETIAAWVRLPISPQKVFAAAENAEANPPAFQASLCVSFQGGESIALARQILARFSPVFLSNESAGSGNEEAVYAAFSAQTNTLHAALAVRRELRCFLPWPPLPQPADKAEGEAFPILPRMGVALSPAESPLEEEKTLNFERALLLAHAAYPGQILVDAAGMEASIGRSSPARFAPLGWFRLLCLAPPILLHALHENGQMDKQDAPENTLNAFRHNLPVEPLPLVGRQQETTQLTALIAGRTPARLVTLSGAGGVGKTRLALESAARAGAFFRGGIWFVPVGNAKNEDELAALVADTLQISLSPQNDTANGFSERRETFAHQVAHLLNQSVSPVCVILDNAEAAPEVAASLAARFTSANPNGPITCVVTSRRPLDLPGEMVFPVRPLLCPSPPAPDAPIEAVKNAVSHSSAGTFFLSRAARLPQNEDWKVVAQLCRTLCGVPLAMELIAAQTAFLTYAEIARRLAHFFPGGEDAVQNALLTMPPPYLLRQTLRLVYELLTPGEKTLLRRVSVLAASASSATAQDTTDDEWGASWAQGAAIAVSEMDEDAARDALDGLEARRLITGRNHQRVRRYKTLPLITEWAGGLLGKNPDEKEAALRAHAVYFCRMARNTYLLGDTPDEADALDALYAERGQLLSAAAYLHSADPLALVPFIADLGDFFLYRAMTQAWQEWPRKAVRIIEMEGRRDIADPRFPDALIQARLYRCGTLVCLHIGDLSSARLYVQSGLMVARDANHRRDIADLLNLRGLVHQKEGQPEKADADWDEARTLYETVGNKRGIVSVLNNRGQLRGLQNDWEAARLCHEEAAQICRLTQDKRGLCYALGNLGCDAFYLKDAPGAQAYFGEQLSVARELKDARNIGAALISLGDVLDQLCHDPAPAIPLLVLGEQIFAKLLHPWEKEAAGYIARIADAGYGANEIAVLRRDFSRRSLPDLIKYPLMPPRRLVLPTGENGKPRFFSTD